jgi:squalene-hopene/tetraprenyl-beta-curcumene cyclase
MSHSRREFVFSAVPGALGLLVAYCRPAGADYGPGFPERAARARARAADYLVGCQAADGAWRSDTYGTFRDGTALTPLALNALLAAAPDRRRPADRAAAYLAAMTRPDGGITPPAYGFDFALYTAALTVTALSHPAVAGHRSARDAWLAYLWQRQLTEDLGWKPEDRPYGGWGYSRGLPRKPRAGELIPPLTESNLSATTFALHALRTAGVPADDARLARALVFVRRCQNWEDDPARRDRAADDGGFFFIYDDPVRNKAGTAGKRYHSYGSATADGLRCLAACGVAESDPRRIAARDWLVRHFWPGHHPGDYEPQREPDRMAVYYYFAASLARCPAGSILAVILRDLAEDLLRRQREDGSWLNPVGLVREDEPIIATSFALLALAGVNGGR